jgi:hypothetical protein
MALIVVSYLVKQLTSKAEFIGWNPRMISSDEGLNIYGNVIAKFESNDEMLR